MKAKSNYSPPVSPVWIGKDLGDDPGRLQRIRGQLLTLFLSPGLLVFVLCGGIIFELLRLFF